VRTLKHTATLDNIANQIEDKYDVPAGFRKQLAAHLKSLADAGKLVKSKTAFVLPGRGAVRGARHGIAMRVVFASQCACVRVCADNDAPRACFFFPPLQPPKGGYDVKMAGYRNKAGGKVPEARTHNTHTLHRPASACMRLLCSSLFTHC
jgi:hypothetical protein